VFLKEQISIKRFMVMGFCEGLYSSLNGLDIVKDVFLKQDSIDDTNYMISKQDK
jgi:hypothetical protein